METANDLTDLERKLVTVIQNNNKRGRSISLGELEMRLGHNAADIKVLINDLIERNWIKENNGKWVVISRLF